MRTRSLVLALAIGLGAPGVMAQERTSQHPDPRSGPNRTVRASTPAAEGDREATGTLRLRIVERKADRLVPVPARVHLADARGEPVLAPGLPAWRDHFNCDGDIRLDLSPGRYIYTVERGPEYRRASGAFT